jgi:hypothetical protein
VEIYDRFARGGNGKPKKMSSKTQKREADLYKKIKTQRGFVETDMARRIDSQLQTDRNLIW